MTRQLLLLLALSILSIADSGLAQETSPPPVNKGTTTPPIPTESPVEVWQPVGVREGNFSILFPVTAKREGKRTRIQMQDGNALETRFTASTANGNYQAAFTFLSDNIATPQAMRQRFAALLQSLKANPRAKWLSGGEIEYRGNPGVEFKIQLLENQTVTWSRQYFAFGCIYEVTARYTPREPDNNEARAFLDSFNLLGPPAQRPTLAAPKQETLPDFTPLTQTTYYVSPGTLRKNALQTVEPNFAKKAPFWEITLRVTVSPEGKVIEVDPGDSSSVLHEEAIKAARKWTFKPFLMAGKPVTVQGYLIFKSGNSGR